MKERRFACPNCGGGLTLEDPAYGLVCPRCEARVAGPFESAHDIPDYKPAKQKSRGHASKKPSIEARVLSPSEYPASITATRGAYTPKIMFAAQHPLGLYYVEDQGAGHLGTFFLSRRSKHAKTIGGANSMAGAFRRISKHEDELIHPDAPREEGKHGPVSIYALGKRTGEPKPKSQLDRELDAWLIEHGYAT